MFGRNQTTINPGDTIGLSRSTAPTPGRTSVPRPSSLSSKADCESVDFELVEKKEKEEKNTGGVLISMPFLGKMRSLLGKSPLRTRIFSGITAVAFSSGLATSKVSWDPSSNNEFTEFALLFSQYKVDRVKLSVWFPNEGSASGTGTSIFIIGADPGMVTTGAPGAEGTSQLSHSARWNAIVTTKSVSSFEADARDVPLVRDMRGFIDTTSSWSGQTCVFAESAVTSTLTAYTYQVEYEVVFRNRF